MTAGPPKECHSPPCRARQGYLDFLFAHIEFSFDIKVEKYLMHLPILQNRRLWQACFAPSCFAQATVARFLLLLGTLLLSACQSMPPPIPEVEVADKNGKPWTIVHRDEPIERWSILHRDEAIHSSRQASRVRGKRTLPDDAIEARLPGPIGELLRNTVCKACESLPYHQQVLQAARRSGVHPALLHAVIAKESGHRPGATSGRQARGLMQIMPATGRWLGVKDPQKLYDPDVNIHAGATYLNMLLRDHRSVEEALAAYNAGPGNVSKYNGIPPFKETRTYIRTINKWLYDNLA